MRHKRHGKSGIAKAHKAEGNKSDYEETKRNVEVYTLDELLEKCLISNITSLAFEFFFVGLFLEPHRVKH